jgi:two-component system sensor histidine kinase MprB
MPLIFERFYRASDARTMPGSGLGLSIVRQAAERHGGSVHAANRLPHGAIFTMRLPGAPTPPPSSYGPDGRSGVSGQGPAATTTAATHGLDRPDMIHMNL